MILRPRLVVFTKSLVEKYCREWFLKWNHSFFVLKSFYKHPSVRLANNIVLVLRVIYVKYFVVIKNNPYICRVEFDKVSIF